MLRIVCPHTVTFIIPSLPLALINRKELKLREERKPTQDTAGVKPAGLCSGVCDSVSSLVHATLFLIVSNKSCFHHPSIKFFLLSSKCGGLQG